ncbi:kelch-like protein 28 [Arctopsyche grandis]|uniref:kelch-like protein 28 n=1 Tax=Arctopsyche grandis TaxID=121162 RepID=UPI00406D682F
MEYKDMTQARHAVKIIGRMFTFYLENSLCNVDLVIGNKRYGVHKLILLSNSEHLKTKFDETCNEIVVEDSHDILTESVEKTIKYLYFGEIDMEIQQVPNVIKLSKLLHLSELEKFCLSYLEQILDKTNFSFIGDFAEEHGFIQLIEHTKSYILNNYLEIIHGEEFLNLSVDRLVALLQSDDLKVMQEEQVFSGMKTWVQKNYEFRKQHLKCLMKCIRFSMLSVEFLFNEVTPLCYGSFECCQSLLDLWEWNQSPRFSLQNFSRFSWILSKPRNKLKHVLIVGGYPVEKSGVIEIYNAYFDRWSTFYNLSFENYRFASVVLDNKLLMIGGDIRGVATNKVWCLDFVTKEMNELKAMDKKRVCLAATVVDGQVYVIGGCDANAYRCVERYDLATDKWTYVASMMTSRRKHEIAVVGKEIFVIGGVDDVQHLNSMEIYDVERDTWRFGASMKEKRDHFTVAAVGNFIYAIGGCNGTAYKINSVERYDIGYNKWEFTADLPEKWEQHRAVAFNGKIICVGGFNNTSVVEFNPYTETWRKRRSILKPRNFFNLLNYTS